MDNMIVETGRNLLHADANTSGSWITHESVMCIHGAAMVLAWAFCCTMGNTFARYLRNAPAKFDKWFPAHIWMQAMTGVFSILSFALIFSHVSYSGGEHFSGLHQVTGLIIFLLMLVQIGVGTFAHLTWYEGKPKSHADLWHWWLGRFVYVLSLANILTGFMQLSSEGKAPNSFLWTLVGALFALLFLGIAGFEVHVFYPDQMKNHTSKSLIVDHHSDSDSSDHTLHVEMDDDEGVSNTRYFQFSVIFASAIGILVVAIGIGLFTCLNHQASM